MKTIIEIARVAGVRDDGHRFEFSEYKYLERFAELVRADERERAMRENAYVLAEREACAKVCENIYEGDEACGDWPSPEQCAAAIRARGNT